MHSRVQFNFVLAVGPAARAAGCVVNGSDMRLRIRLPYTRRYYYPDATVLCDQEIRAAALQFVRKVSGYRQPSRANAEAFEEAVDDVEATCRRLLDSLARRSPRSVL